MGVMLLGWPMNTGFSLEEEALYDRTMAAVLGRLRKTRNPGDLLAVIRQAHKGFGARQECEQKDDDRHSGINPALPRQEMTRRRRGR